MDLTGKLLAAMPGMGDQRFDRALVMICAHSNEGAMGLIVNRNLPDLSFSALLTQLGISTDRAPAIAVHYGGPVERNRGFVLHQGPFQGQDSTMQIQGGYQMTATVDILQALALGQGPQDVILALGYSGWGPQQLEDEIRQNSWLILDASHQVIFDCANDQKWADALRHSGVDPINLSAAAGRA
jgi:putative transcriptional regulator